MKEELIDKLFEECSVNIDENETIDNKTLNDYERVFNSCTIYTVLFSIFLIIGIRVISVYFYFHRYLKKVNIETSSYICTLSKVFGEFPFYLL